MVPKGRGLVASQRAVPDYKICQITSSGENFWGSSLCYNRAHHVLVPSMVIWGFLVNKNGGRLKHRFFGDHAAMTMCCAALRENPNKLKQRSAFQSEYVAHQGAVVCIFFNDSLLVNYKNIFLNDFRTKDTRVLAFDLSNSQVPSWSENT